MDHLPEQISKLLRASDKTKIIMNGLPNSFTGLMGNGGRGGQRGVMDRETEGSPDFLHHPEA